MVKQIQFVLSSSGLFSSRGNIPSLKVTQHSTVLQCYKNRSFKALIYKSTANKSLKMKMKISYGINRNVSALYRLVTEEVVLKGTCLHPGGLTKKQICHDCNLFIGHFTNMAACPSPKHSVTHSNVPTHYFTMFS